MEVEENLTALERKWREEAELKGPSLDDAYTEDGFNPEKLEQAVRDRIPTPTGWRTAVLRLLILQMPELSRCRIRMDHSSLVLTEKFITIWI